MDLCRSTTIVLAVAAACANAFAAPAHDLNLIPYPQSVELRGEGPSLASLRVLMRPATMPDGPAGALVEELARAGVAIPSVARTAGDALVVALVHSPRKVTSPAVSRDRGPEAYALRSDPSGVVIAAADPRGLARGVQTLRQLIRANCREGRLPGVLIQDWPALTWRAFQDDLTRGPSSSLRYLSREIDLGAYLKLNVFTYYMESQYAFAKHPSIAPSGGALTPGDLDALVRHGAEHAVEVMGNQQSFGHMDRILAHPEFAPIAETPYLLTPASEETYRFLDDLYSEVLPHLTFPLFNVCCDETYGLGAGPSKEWVAREGEGAVYVSHIRRLHDLVAGKYGKQMMMWGDIILTHPEFLDRIPKDVVMLTWGYGVASSFDGQILPFVKSGFRFFVCPGTSNWSRVLPDFDTSTRNIEQFVRDGVRNGALGTIITCWDDDGLTLDPQNWYGSAWGAECAWTGSQTRLDDFERRLGAVLLGEPNGEFGKALAILRTTPSKDNAAFFSGPTESVVLVSPEQGKKRLHEVEVLRGRLLEAIGRLRAGAAGASANADLVAYFRHGARRLELIARREEDAVRSALLYRAAAEGEMAPRPALSEILRRYRGSRAAHAASRAEFVRLWNAINRPYALDWSLAAYDRLLARYDAVLAKLDAAQSSTARTGVLPPAEDLGLAANFAPSPRFSSVRTVAEPLKPAAPWAVSDAAHRFAIAVQHLRASRAVTPVEAEVSLPPALARGPVRAFVESEDGVTREVPCQIDATTSPGRVRLTVVLPPGGTRDSLTVWVYLGGRASGLPPGAVSTSRSDSVVWMENDRVRVMLGATGAHLFRWEVKALGGRDATLAGDTDYAGFSDVNAYRGVVHELYPAAAGPAVVRWFAVAPDGLVKTISLYAGASWVDVTFGRPLPYYWDFEDPALFRPGEPANARFIFENGMEGPAPAPPGDIPRQVAASGVRWGAKWVPGGLLLALLTPDEPTTHVIGPGAGAGGLGIERGGQARHFVTYCDVPGAAPADVLNDLAGALRLDAIPDVTAYGVQGR